MPPPESDSLFRPIIVRIIFGTSAKFQADNHYTLEIRVKKDGSESIYEVKKRIAEAAGGDITADDLLLSFGPNERKIGKQFKGDPTIDETKFHLSQFSVLSWIERFPTWTLSAKLLPSPPPPPGVAIKQAAAMAEQKDPERAVQDGRARGEIPKINDLPAPWGPKPYIQPPEEDLLRSGYLPARYPPTSSPLIDA